ncbi:LacI family DNA-binding transcriptional regulator [Parapedobacter pyrenivorans]|nr:LacI family DNA-binding transcriptional regulator [Parapedobacter pyrenivorans]
MDIIKLAEVLNLSKSTVSRAFRDSSDISAETKQRILAKARELNYHPNHYASNMREQKSMTIAVVVPELANNYFTQIIQGVEKVAKTSGYHILIYVTDDDIAREQEFIRGVSNGRVDGIVMSVSGESKDHSYLAHVDVDRLPIVLFDRIYDDIDLPKIVTDDYDSSFRSTEHLIQQGCSRIAYLVVNKEQSIGKVRMQGYMDALRKYRIPLRKRLIVDCTNSYDENAGIIENAIQKQRPDGILASVERLAFSTYYACGKLSVRIPDDLKIVAFSSLEIASLLSPALTTVTQPAIQIGERAAALLLKKLQGTPIDDTERLITMESELVIRASSLPA